MPTYYIAGIACVVILLALVLVRRFGIGSSTLRKLLEWMEREDLQSRVAWRPIEVSVGVHVGGETPDVVLSMRERAGVAETAEEEQIYVELYTLVPPKDAKRQDRLVIHVWTSPTDRAKYTLMFTGSGSKSKLISADLYERGAPGVEAAAAIKILEKVLEIVASTKARVARTS